MYPDRCSLEAVRHQFRVDRGHYSVWDLIPSASALQKTEVFFYEVLGLARLVALGSVHPLSTSVRFTVKQNRPVQRLPHGRPSRFQQILASIHLTHRRYVTFSIQLPGACHRYNHRSPRFFQCFEHLLVEGSFSRFAPFVSCLADHDLNEYLAFLLLARFSVSRCCLPCESFSFAHRKPHLYPLQRHMCPVGAESTQNISGRI